MRFNASSVLGNTLGKKYSDSAIIVGRLHQVRMEITFWGSTASVVQNLRRNEMRNASCQSCWLTWQDLRNAYQFNFSPKEWKTEKWKTEHNCISC